MSSNQTFDVDQFKTEHECDEHWELRRIFLLEHKDKYPEDRLVCLAQVFINIEILGCRYPDETMQLVSKLSEGVADEYRIRKKGKLQRTFVKASDAAEMRAKGVQKRSHASLAAVCQSDALSSNPPTKYPKTINFTAAPASSKIYNTAPGPWLDGYQSFQSSVAVDQSTQDYQSTTLPNDIRNILKNVIIFENKFVKSPAIETLTRSLQHSHLYTKELVQYSSSPGGGVCCGIFVNGKEVVSVSKDTKVKARDAAASALLQQMKEFCYTILIKEKFVSETTVDTQSLNNGKEKGRNGDILPDLNVGNKLLRMMGWSGGGLGKNQQGITEPISVTEHINRAGLGQKGKVNIKQQLCSVLLDYSRSDSDKDLAFSSDFTKEERAVIHELAKRYRLKSKSHGGGEYRQLIISKKEKPKQLLNRLIKSGGSTEKFDVIKPKCYV